MSWSWLALAQTLSIKPTNSNHHVQVHLKLKMHDDSQLLDIVEK